MELLMNFFLKFVVALAVILFILLVAGLAVTEGIDVAAVVVAGVALIFAICS
jgi:hypothetical protein